MVGGARAGGIFRRRRTSGGPLLLAIGLLFGLTLVGTVGFMLSEDLGFLDALYMSVITLSTVGYQDVAPSRIEAIRGFVGSPSVRPIRLMRPTAAVQSRPTERELTFKDQLPRRQVLDLQPMPAALQPGSHSLADLIADRDWRKRTSDKLNRLFQ